MEPPPIEYVRTGGVSVAYQVVGIGPIDLVYIPLNLSIAIGWEQPIVATFYERLASFSRLILLDKRGTGISDRPRAPLTLEAQMDDVRAVLDAVGSDQAALLGGAQGAQMCALFAATYPERSSAVLLWNARIRFPGSEEDKRDFLRMIYERWGTEDWIDYLLEANYPSFANDSDFRRWMAKGVRVSASPGSALEFLRVFAEADIQDILPAVRAPSLVMYRRDMETKALFTQNLAEEAELLAKTLPNARLVAVPGRDMAPYVGHEVADEVERFLAAPEAPAVSDRVLATVLFTDIVSSTEQAAALGDKRWRDVLTEHRNAVRRELSHFRGEEVDTAGDGFLATFDGPARAIACAQAVVSSGTAHGLTVRAGLHTGECELADGKVAGLAVHIGARVVGEAAAGEVLVSRTVKDLVAGSGLEFDDRGARRLKGVPGEWELFAVRS
jgi:class 3 adenylate cyclase